jgi:hypothetical protein
MFCLLVVVYMMQWLLLPIFSYFMKAVNAFIEDSYFLLVMLLFVQLAQVRVNSVKF